MRRTEDDLRRSAVHRGRLGLFVGVLVVSAAAVVAVSSLTELTAVALAALGIALVGAPRLSRGFVPDGPVGSSDRATPPDGN